MNIKVKHWDASYKLVNRANLASIHNLETLAHSKFLNAKSEGDKSAWFIRYRQAVKLGQMSKMNFSQHTATA